MPDADETADDAAVQTTGESPAGEAWTSDAAEVVAETPDQEPAEGPDDALSVPGDVDEPEVARSYELDPVLAGSEDVARAALAEITEPETIGELVATIADGEHVVSLQFANLMRGYPGWFWTATLSRIDKTEDVNILEVELLPGEGSVLAPDWVPWSVRLADYTAAQDAAGVDGEDDLDGVLDEDDDLDDDDESDEDESDEDDTDEDDSDDDEDESDEDEDDESDDEDDESDDDESDDEDELAAPPARDEDRAPRRRRRRR